MKQSTEVIPLHGDYCSTKAACALSGNSAHELCTDEWSRNQNTADQLHCSEVTHYIQYVKLADCAPLGDV